MLQPWRGWIVSLPTSLNKQHHIVRSAFRPCVIPLGRRRQSLETAFARSLKEDLENRVLDLTALQRLKLRPWRPRDERRGRPVDTRDTQSAGIALARRAALATQNVRHFLDLEISMVNPSRD